MFGSLLFFIIVGLFFALAPAFVWFIAIGWLFKNAEPSDAVLIVIRWVGYVFLFISAIYIVDFILS